MVGVYSNRVGRHRVFNDFSWDSDLHGKDIKTSENSEMVRAPCVTLEMASPIPHESPVHLHGCISNSSVFPEHKSCPRSTSHPPAHLPFVPSPLRGLWGLGEGMSEFNKDLTACDDDLRLGFAITGAVRTCPCDYAQCLRFGCVWGQSCTGQRVRWRQNRSK